MTKAPSDLNLGVYLGNRHVMPFLFESFNYRGKCIGATIMSLWNDTRHVTHSKLIAANQVSM